MKNNHQKAPLYDALIDYGLKSNPIAFDVPGHKLGNGIPKEFKDAVGADIFKLDVNSMKELDSLSNPIGVIKEAEALAADLFQADHAFFLVNGSTSGVQNMILSTCTDGDKIILPRNIHKSAFNAIVLAGAVPIYIAPHIDEFSGVSMGVRSADVIKAIDAHPDAKAVFLLHPTYFGYTSDFKTIANYAHQHNMAVLADQSHGSHFSLHNDFPQSATVLGADMATISMHKTGGSLTQSSILLHNNGIIPYSRVRSTVNLFQTSSASYLLLASLDIARKQLALESSSRFKTLLPLVKSTVQKLNNLPGIQVLSDHLLDNDAMHGFDITKITIDVSAYGMSGFKVYDYFKARYNIQLELGESHVVLAVVSLGDTKASLNALYEAFKDFTSKHALNPKKTVKHVKLRIPEMVFTPRHAFFAPSMLIALSKSIDMISADSIMVYPPGIPLVVPGEKITQAIINDYAYLSKEGNILIGAHQKDTNVYIKVLKP